LIASPDPNLSRLNNSLWAAVIFPVGLLPKKDMYEEGPD
jgi:hypothetical protein